MVAAAAVRVTTCARAALTAVCGLQEGVSVAAVEAALRGTKVVRSATCILVKNLPSTADERLVRERFGRFGALSRVVLTPSRMIGVVEFVDAEDAKYGLSRVHTTAAVACLCVTYAVLRACVQTSVPRPGVHEGRAGTAVPRVGSRGRVLDAATECRRRRQGEGEGRRTGH